MFTLYYKRRFGRTVVATEVTLIDLIFVEMEVQSIGDIVIRADIRFRIGCPLFNSIYFILRIGEVCYTIFRGMREYTQIDRGNI